ncbi:MAG: hypothetical protein COS92_03225 [Desulfobacterales bacterium CG07_land_8_20_14_0_80_52_14]|nr:MAG: hypothetical protein COS92_03225 [Desulfobacterales bacterium CG07_land_8_20_14_0_80_52_14]
MKTVGLLILPRLWPLKRPLASAKGKKPLRILILGGIGTVFWVGILGVSMRVLRYFRGIEDVGDLVLAKLLSMMLITVFSLMIFSAVLTSLSKLYLSKDLPLVFSLPVRRHHIFIARWMESVFDSAWMVLIYTLPVLIAYGIVYDVRPLYYAYLPAALIPLTATASGIGVLVVMLAVMVIPASRIRTLFVFLGLFAFIAIYVAFRLLRPERLVDPEAFATVLVYLHALKSPDFPFLPSTWAYDGIHGLLIGDIREAIFAASLSFAAMLTLFYAVVLTADAVYFSGLSKAQTAKEHLFRARREAVMKKGVLPGPIRALVEKEIKTFFRDQTQWSQIFLIAALVVIYIYNFKVLPLERSPIKTLYLQNLLSFLNMGLVSFVLIAVTARFAFPAVSNEKDAFWLVLASPIRMRTYLWVKFFIYFFPLLILSEILIVGTNILLKVTPLMMGLSTATICVLVPGVVSLGIGLGAAYPDFTSENPAQSVTSWGGLLFMMLGAVFVGAVIFLEAGPVYRFFMAQVKEHTLFLSDWIYAGISFAGVLILAVFAVILPMRYGERELLKTDS